MIVEILLDCSEDVSSISKWNGVGAHQGHEFCFFSVAFLLFFPFFFSCLVKDGSLWLVALTIVMPVFQYKNSNLRLLLCKDNPKKKKSKSRVLLKAREGGKEGRVKNGLDSCKEFNNGGGCRAAATSF